jgi:predicted transcriptional regulator
MSKEKQKSFNHKKTFNTQVYELICKRLNLKRREKIILFKFLGFLFRNDKPFVYSIEKLALNSGYKKSSIFESINLLENHGIIERVGFTSRVRYTKGSRMIKYCTLVQNRIKNALSKNQTLLQKMDEFFQTTPETGYKKTYSSLKHKEADSYPQPQKPLKRTNSLVAISSLESIKDILNKR